MVDLNSLLQIFGTTGNRPTAQDFINLIMFLYANGGGSGSNSGNADLSGFVGFAQPSDVNVTPVPGYRIFINNQNAAAAYAGYRDAQGNALSAPANSMGILFYTGAAWGMFVYTVTKDTLGLGNVDNTSDADKPLSDATREAVVYLQDQLNLLNNITTVRGSVDTFAELNALDTDEEQIKQGDSYIVLEDESWEGNSSIYTWDGDEWNWTGQWTVQLNAADGDTPGVVESSDDIEFSEGKGKILPSDNVKQIVENSLPDTLPSAWADALQTTLLSQLQNNPDGSFIRALNNLIVGSISSMMALIVQGQGYSNVGNISIPLLVTDANGKQTILKLSSLFFGVIGNTILYPEANVFPFTMGIRGFDTAQFQDGQSGILLNFYLSLNGSSLSFSFVIDNQSSDAVIAQNLPKANIILQGFVGQFQRGAPVPQNAVSFVMNNTSQAVVTAMAQVAQNTLYVLTSGQAVTLTPTTVNAYGTAPLFIDLSTVADGTEVTATLYSVNNGTKTQVQQLTYTAQSANNPYNNSGWQGLGLDIDGSVTGYELDIE